MLQEHLVGEVRNGTDVLQSVGRSLEYESIFAEYYNIGNPGLEPACRGSFQASTAALTLRLPAHASPKRQFLPFEKDGLSRRGRAEGSGRTA